MYPPNLPQPPAFEIIEAVPLITSGYSNVRALVTVRRGGVKIQRCRLIELPERGMRLFGPQVRQALPDGSILYCTIADWLDTDAIQMGQVAAEYLRERGLCQ